MHRINIIEIYFCSKSIKQIKHIRVEGMSPIRSIILVLSPIRFPPKSILLKRNPETILLVPDFRFPPRSPDMTRNNHMHILIKLIYVK